MGEFVAGLPVCKSLADEASFIKPFLSSIDDNVMTELLFENSARWLGARIDMLNALMNTSLAIFSVALAKSLDPGFVGVALIQCLQLSGVFQYSIRQAAEVESLMTSVERISQFSQLDSEEPSRSSQKDPKRPPPENWPSQGRITMTDVQLRYADELPLALNGITACIEPGSVVGIVGRTGSGKSTLIKAFFRLVELCGGKIEIDGTDLRTLSLSDMRRRLTVITQTPTLFDGTLRSNVDPFSEHSDAAVQSVVERCHLSHLLAPEDGLGMRVKAGGSNFSAGERQLICAARALLVKPQMLFLDEASSNIDAETDALLQTMLRRDFDGATKVIIAHRLETIIDASIIMVLDQGRLVEMASPAQLLGKEDEDGEASYFATLVDAMGSQATQLRQEAEIAEQKRSHVESV